MQRDVVEHLAHAGVLVRLQNRINAAACDRPACKSFHQILEDRIAPWVNLEDVAVQRREVIALGLLALFVVVAQVMRPLVGLIVALGVAIFVYGMPTEMAGKSALLGALFGLLPIGWIVLNIIFLHQLTEKNGSFQVLQDSIAGITEDRRLQLLLIAIVVTCVLASGCTSAQLYSRHVSNSRALTTQADNGELRR